MQHAITDPNLQQLVQKGKAKRPSKQAKTKKPAITEAQKQATRDKRRATIKANAVKQRAQEESDRISRQLSAHFARVNRAHAFDDATSDGVCRTYNEWSDLARGTDRMEHISAAFAEIQSEPAIAAEHRAYWDNVLEGAKNINVRGTVAPPELWCPWIERELALKRTPMLFDQLEWAITHFFITG